MSENKMQSDFCPKCGALMRENICQSCEFTVADSEETTMVGTSKKNKCNGFLTCGFILMMVVVVFCATALWGVFRNRDLFFTDKDAVDAQNDIRDTMTSSDEYRDSTQISANIVEVEGKSDDENGRIDLNNDGIGDLEFELGEEGLNAEYYPLLTDYLRYDLSYSVSFLEYNNGEENVSCIYPKVKGNKKSIDYINQFFSDFALETEKKAIVNEYNAKSQAYVTYMDENLLSVVFTEVYTKKDNTNFEYIYCYIIDMSSEDFVISKFELKDTSNTFLTELETRCLKESANDAQYLFGNYTKDEIRSLILTAEDGLVAFYTPLGMEIGLNYDGYWCCATFKNYEEYIRCVETEDIN